MGTPYHLRMPRPDGSGAPGAARAGAAFVLALAVVFAALLFAPAAVTGDPTIDVVVRLCLAAGVAAGIVILLTPPGSEPTTATRGWLVTGLVAVFLAGGAALVLSGTDFPPLGIALDQGFRAASVTKYAHTAALVDFAYRDLPAFYPPLYFWVLGRGAAWLGAPTYEMMKLGVLVCALAAPLAAFGLWRRLTRDAMVALAVAVGALAFQDWYEPYAWLAVVVFVPWWSAFVLQVGRDRPLGRRALAWGAIIGAAVFCTYYYFFFIGAVHLVLALALRRPVARAGLVLGPRRPRDTTIVLGGAALLSAVYWLPLLVSIVTTPGARSMQNRYYDATVSGIPLPFLEFDLVGWLMLIGLTYLVVAMFRSELALALSTLLGAAYAWYLLGEVGVLVDVPLLTVKTNLLIDVVLLAGTSLAVVEVGRALLRARPLIAGFGAWGVRTAVVVVAAVVVVSLGTTAMADIPYVDEQRAAVEPVALLDAFDRATRGAAADTVVLTDQEAIPELRPVYVFNVWNAHYSHPAAEFDDRSRFLERLAAEDDPAVFAAALRRNRYDRVDSVALRPDGDELRYSYFADAFPRGVTRETIVFREEQFDDAWFDRRGSPDLAVFVPRDRDPFTALDDGQRRALRRRFAGDLG